MHIVGPSVFKKNALHDKPDSGIVRATILFNGKIYALYENLFHIAYLRRYNTELYIQHRYKYLDENMNIITGYWGSPCQIDKFRTLPGNVFTHQYTPALNNYTCNLVIEFNKGTMDTLREAY
jgi:hypothetical protein